MRLFYYSPKNKIKNDPQIGSTITLNYNDEKIEIYVDGTSFSYFWDHLIGIADLKTGIVLYLEHESGVYSDGYIPNKAFKNAAARKIFLEYFESKIPDYEDNEE